jgi:uncharacterized protein
MVTPVASKREVLERLHSEGAHLRRSGVRRIGLFGSFVTDRADTNSDIDLLVEFDPATKNFDNYLALAELLESRLQRPVDLLTRESLSPHIGPRILAEVEYVSLGE